MPIGLSVLRLDRKIGTRQPRSMFRPRPNSTRRQLAGLGTQTASIPRNDSITDLLKLPQTWDLIEPADQAPEEIPAAGQRCKDGVDGGCGTQHSDPLHRTVRRVRFKKERVPRTFCDVDRCLAAKFLGRLTGPELNEASCPACDRPVDPAAAKPAIAVVKERCEPLIRAALGHGEL